PSPRTLRKCCRPRILLQCQCRDRILVLPIPICTLGTNVSHAHLSGRKRFRSHTSLGTPASPVLLKNLLDHLLHIGQDTCWPPTMTGSKGGPSRPYCSRNSALILCA